MNKETAWNEVVTRLEAIAGIVKVYQGFHELESVPDSHKPCIILEPDTTTVLEDNYDESGGNYALEQLNLVLTLLFNVWEKGKAVTGKVGILGVFEWEKLVKDALGDIPEALGYKVAKVSFGDVVYLHSAVATSKEFVRALVIDVQLLIPYSTG
jgi:hypothetical protein